MKTCFVFALLFAVAVCLPFPTGAQEACQEVCRAEKAECRTEAERAAQQDADIPFWAKDSNSRQRTFSKHNTPRDPAPSQAREDSFRNRRQERLASCEDRYRTCRVSCTVNNFNGFSR